MTSAPRDKPQAVVERFLRATSALDVDSMFDEIGEDAVWSFPAGPAGGPREIQGKDTNRAFFEGIRPMWKAFELTFIEVHSLADAPDQVMAYYGSIGELLDSSAYSNTYLALVTVRDGKIREWVEFCDPEPLARGVAVLQTATS